MDCRCEWKISLCRPLTSQGGNTLVLRAPVTIHVVVLMSQCVFFLEQTGPAEFAPRRQTSKYNSVVLLFACPPGGAAVCCPHLPDST